MSRSHVVFTILLSCVLALYQGQTASGQPGVDWTVRSSAADNTWKSVTYGNGLFVAVSSTGTGNRVMTSPDGITWTSRTSAADNSWTGVAYGGGLFVAVSSTGTGNRVMTSPDGITWTSRASAANNSWNAVTYGNGLFVAVAGSGTGNRVMTSPDGITWTSQTSAGDNSWNAVTYGNGLFVAVHSNSSSTHVMTSPDGVTWTMRNTPNTIFRSVTYGNGMFVAVASGTANRVITSPDGITWTSRTAAVLNSWMSVTYADGLFVAVSNSGTADRVMTSPDGITWISRTSAADISWIAVTYGQGMVVAVSGDGTGNRVMTSDVPAIVWDGSESTDWNTPENWVGDAVPLEADNTRIPSGTPNQPTVTSPDQPIVCNGVLVESGASLTIEGGNNFVINGVLSNEGTVIVQTDADLAGIGSLITHGAVTGGGDFQMEQSLLGAGGAAPSGVFNYVSSPVAGATSAIYSAAGTDKLWSANEATQNYTEITDNTTPLNVGQGYVARVGADGEVTFTGTAFNTGIVSIGALTRTGTSATDRGYNLVANPYPSSVDWNTVSRTNLMTTYWVRTHTPGLVMTNDTYNSMGDIGTNNNGNGDLTSVIPPTQAFWVRVDADGNTGRLDFDNEDRLHQSWASIYRLAAEEGTVRIQIGNGTVNDETIIVFNPEALDGFDAFDSQKMWAANIPQFYTTVGTDSLVINGLYSTATNPIVDLGVKLPTVGDYSFTATSITLNEEVWLEDRFLNQFQQLNVNPVYAFVSNAGNIGDRFALHFGMMAVGVGTDAINRVSTTHVFAADGIVNVSVSDDITTGMITILDMTGRTVQTAAISGSRTVVATDLITGIYLVRIETTKGAETHRIMLR
ncbi:MAG: T9SS type A sorting domain-containing protein [Flavobacteriales bacterium]|nr:T9SS type A sorting domain-containing protein [Flavobacteriales bacterium]